MSITLSNSHPILLFLQLIFSHTFQTPDILFPSVHSLLPMCYQGLITPAPPLCARGSLWPTCLWWRSPLASQEVSEPAPNLITNYFLVPSWVSTIRGSILSNRLWNGIWGMIYLSVVNMYKNEEKTMLERGKSSWDAVPWKPQQTHSVLWSHSCLSVSPLTGWDGWASIPPLDSVTRWGLLWEGHDSGEAGALCRLRQSLKGLRERLTARGMF